MNSAGFEKIRQHKGEVLLCVLAAVLLVPNVINLFLFSAESVEAFSVKLANMKPGEMLSVTAADVHPPLYYLILHIAVALFGNAGPIYRLVSLIPYFILLAYALLFLRREFGIWCAALFVMFASFTTTALRFNTHIRMYSWCALFLTLCFHELYRIFMGGGRRHYVYLAVFTLCAGYLQYYALVTAALLYLFLLICIARERSVVSFKNWLLSAVLAVGGYLPWLTVFVRSLQRTAAEYWIPETESFMHCYKSLFSARFSAVWPTLWLLAVVYVIMKDLRQKEGGTREKKKAGRLSGNSKWLLAGVFSVIGTIVAGILISVLIRPMFNTRYLYPASPIAWMSLAVCAEKLKNKKVVVPVVMSVFLLLQTQAYIRAMQIRLPADEQIWQATETVREKGTEGAILLSGGSLGGYDDNVILEMGYATSPVTDYYFRGIAEEIRIDQENPAGWAIPRGRRCFLFAGEALPDEALRILEERGYSVECLSESGFYAYSIYYLLPQGE